MRVIIQNDYKAVSKWAAAYVANAINKFKPTVLHCFSASKAKLTRYLAETLNIPFLLTFNTSTHKKLSRVASSPNCAALLALTGPIATHLKSTNMNFNGQVAQLNTGTFVEDDCACFSAEATVRSMVVAQPLTNANDFKGLLNAVRHLVIDDYEFILAIIGMVVFASFVRLWPYNMSLTLNNYDVDVQGGYAPLWTSIWMSCLAAAIGVVMVTVAAYVIQKLENSFTGSSTSSPFCPRRCPAWSWDWVISSPSTTRSIRST